MPTLPKESQWLRASIAARPIGVDRDKKRINGFIVAEEGVFRDRRGEFDRPALREVVRLMRMEPNGLKSRFGHPSMSGDAIGTFLGRAKDPWRDKLMRPMGDGTFKEVEVVRANLHLSETAFENNPNGNIGQWVMDAAEKDPEGALGASLVLTVDQITRRDDKGRPLTDETTGDELPPLWMPKELHAVDATDTGDATRSFLSADILADLPDAVVRQGAELIDRQFGNQPREVTKARLLAFVERYLNWHYGEEEISVPPDPARDPKAWRMKMGI